jgi:hypothetical protein
MNMQMDMYNQPHVCMNTGILPKKNGVLYSDSEDTSDR